MMEYVDSELSLTLYTYIWYYQNTEDLLSEGRYEQAYRMVPVHPKDQHLYILGIHFQGLVYIHT